MRRGHAPPASIRSRSRAEASHDGPPKARQDRVPSRAAQVKEAATAKRRGVRCTRHPCRQVSLRVSPRRGAGRPHPPAMGARSVIHWCAAPGPVACRRLGPVCQPCASPLRSRAVTGRQDRPRPFGRTSWPRRLSGPLLADGGGTLHRFSQSDRPLDADELPHFGDHRLVRVQLDPQQGADPSCVWARAGRHQPFAFVSLSGGGAWSSSASLTAADASDDCGRRCRNLWLVNARPPLTLTRRSLADSTSHTHYCCRTLHRMTRC